jgi:hypothetical protein
VSDDRFVGFLGEQFKVRGSVALMALMRFAHIAQGGTDSGEMEGLAAMYDLLESAIDEGDWGRFQDHALKTRATDKDLMLLVRKVIRGETDRPTQRPSDSSDGPGSTEQKSESEEPVSPEPQVEEPVQLRVVRRLESEGRPDKAAIVLQAQEAMSSAV